MGFGKLDVEPFTEGTCFICGKQCGDGRYCHYECAVAYEAMLEKKREEALQRKRDKETKCNQQR